MRRKLIAAARSPEDRAIFTLATEGGPRLIEIRPLKVGNVDFDVGVVRIEDGYGTAAHLLSRLCRRARYADVG